MYDKNGEIIYIERIKNIITFQDHDLFPSKIEDILKKHPAVLEAIVIGIPDKFDNERPLAFIKTVPGSKVNFSLCY